MDTALEPTYDIDVSVSTLQAYAHQQRTPPKPSSGMIGLPPSRMAREKWFKLTPRACQIWDQLDDHSKSVILAPTEKCTANGTHKISAYDCLLANMHSSSEQAILDPHAQADTSIGDFSPPVDTEAHSQVLVNAAKQTKSIQSLADIHQVLSNTMA